MTATKPLAAVIVVGVMVAASAVAPADATTIPLVSIQSIGRDASSGNFTFDVVATVNDWAVNVGVCDQNNQTCEFDLQAELSDLSTVSLASIVIPTGSPATYSHHFIGSATTSKVIAVRAYIVGYYQVMHGDWAPVNDPYLSPSVTVSISSAGRDSSNGHFTYDFTATEQDQQTPAGVCWPSNNGCSFDAFGQREDGSTVSLGSFGIPGNSGSPFSHQFAGDVATTKVVAVKVNLIGYSRVASSTWVPVADPGLTPTVSASIASFGRDPSTGNLAYDITATEVSEQTPAGVCSGSTCTFQLDAQQADGTIVNLGYSDIGGGAGSPFSHQFVGTVPANKVLAIRAAVIGDHSAYGDWVPVTDPGTSPTIAVAVNSVGRNTSTGHFTYDVTVTATAEQTPAGVCVNSYCNITVFAQAADGSAVALDGLSVPSQSGLTYSHQFTGDIATSKIVSVGAYIAGYYTTVKADWIPVTDPQSLPTFPVSVTATGAVSRDTGSGDLVYDVSVSESGAIDSSSICTISYYVCRMGVQAKTASGEVTTLASTGNSSIYGTSYSQQFTGQTSSAPIVAIRGWVSGDAGFGAGIWVDVTDPYPTPAVTLSVTSVGRDTATGDLTYDLTTTANAVTLGTSVCRVSSYICRAGVQAKTAAGDIVEIATTNNNSIYGQPSPHLEHFVSQRSSAQIVAVRGEVRGDSGSLFSSWHTVVDPYTTPSITLTGEVGRDKTNGQLTYDFTATETNATTQNSVCTNQYYICRMTVQARTVGGDVIDLVSTNNTSVFGQPSPYSQPFTGSTTAVKIVAVRATISGDSGSLHSTWTDISDPALTEGVAAKVASIVPTGGGSGTYSYDITATATGFKLSGSICQNTSYNCTIYLQAERNNGDSAYLNQTTLSGGETYPYSHQFTGTTGISDLRRVRTVLIGLGGTKLGKWVPVSNNVSKGHDVDAMLAAILAEVVVMGPLQSCVNLLPQGTHLTNSTVNDQQAACLEVAQNNGSITAFFTNLLGSLSARQLSALMVRVGIRIAAQTRQVSPNIDYGVPLEPGCSYGTYPAIVCGSITYRAPSAPPQQDPTWEANHQGAPDDDPVPPPSTGPLAGAPQSVVTLTENEECEEQVQSIPGLLDDVVSEDPCDGIPVFFTGWDVREASQHDADVIADNPSTMFLHAVLTGDNTATHQTVYTDVCPGPPRPLGPDGEATDCDEYPFFSSDEGILSGNDPNLRLINFSQNRSQGARLNGFYDQAPSFFTGCPQFKQGPPHSNKRLYLVVPVHELVLPTFWECNVH